MYVYVIECADGSLYTGVAVDVVKRISQHYYKKKEGAKYTKSHRPTSLRGLWTATDKSAACRLEYRIKQLSRAEKLTLLDNPCDLTAFFGDIIDIDAYGFSTAPERKTIFDNAIGQP